MYLNHFGFTRPPFAINPDPRFLYLSAKHQEALAHLLFGLGEGGGFVMLSGEVGTGKTTLCFGLLEQLHENVDVALILNPRLNALELLCTLCDELQIAYPEACDSPKPLIDRLNRFLLDNHARGRRTVLVIDEAQNLSPEVLEQIRLLTNLETPTTKLLQIVLVGQPELPRLLSRRELRQVDQRITARYHLRPLSGAETRAYIAHRLAVGNGPSDLFTRPALRAVHRYARGIPRLINAICDRALLGAYARDLHRIDANIVREAAAEVGLSAGQNRRWQPAHGVGIGLAAVLGAIVLWQTLPFRPHLPQRRQELTLGAIDTPAPIPVRDTEAAPQPAEKPSPPSPPFAEWIAHPPRPQDLALSDLVKLWRPADQPVPTRCDRLAAIGLRCLPRSGNWTELRRLNLPAVLRFRLGPAADQHAVLAWADGNRARFRNPDGTSVEFPLSEVLAHWDGDYLVLYAIPHGRTVLGRGAEGPAVGWLRQRLEAAGHAAPETATPEIFDADLRDALRRFQTAAALRADGVAGPETLAHLVGAAPTSGTPILSRPNPAD